MVDISIEKVAVVVLVLLIVVLILGFFQENFHSLLTNFLGNIYYPSFSGP